MTVTVLDVYVPPPSVDVDVYGVCQRIEQWASEATDIGALKDNKSKLSAIDQYIAQTSTEGRKVIGSAMRLLELRIGEVIGAAQVGANQHCEPSIATEGSLSKDERYQFRLMAENRDVVEAVIAASTDAAPPSRNKVLQAIQNKKIRDIEDDSRECLAAELRARGVDPYPPEHVVLERRRIDRIISTVLGVVCDVLEAVDQIAPDEAIQYIGDKAFPRPEELDRAIAWLTAIRVAQERAAA